MNTKYLQDKVARLERKKGVRKLRKLDLMVETEDGKFYIYSQKQKNLMLQALPENNREEQAGSI